MALLVVTAVSPVPPPLGGRPAPLLCWCMAWASVALSPLWIARAGFWTSYFCCSRQRYQILEDWMGPWTLALPHVAGCCEGRLAYIGVSRLLTWWVLVRIYSETCCLGTLRSLCSTDVGQPPDGCHVPRYIGPDFWPLLFRVRLSRLYCSLL